MTPTIDDWYQGDPEAKRVGVERLRAVHALPKKSLRVRMAVATLQQRWGHAPTGTLSPSEWEMLAEQAEPSPASTNDGSEPSRKAEDNASREAADDSA